CLACLIGDADGGARRRLRRGVDGVKQRNRAGEARCPDGSSHRRHSFTLAWSSRRHRSSTARSPAKSGSRKARTAAAPRDTFPSRSVSMTRVTYLVSAAAMLAASIAIAQPPARGGGGQMQGQKIGLATSLQRGYAAFKRNFTAAAEKMPE